MNGQPLLTEQSGGIDAARGELDLALRWMKFVEIPPHRIVKRWEAHLR
jgi:hypothetical protein